MKGLGVRFAKAFGHGHEEFVGQGRHGVEEAVETALLQDEKGHVGVGDDRGRAGAAVEKGKLSEVAARLEGGELAAVTADRGLAFDDEEELPADGALFAEDLARGDLD